MMKSAYWMSVAAVLGCLLPLEAMGAEGGSVQLVDNGKPTCVIVTPGKGAAGAQLDMDSDKLLADHLKRMSGAEVKVVLESDLAAEVRDGRVVAPAGQADAA